MTVAEIAALVGGDFVGNGALIIESGHSLEKAAESQLAFWERRPGRSRLPRTRAGCVIVDREARAAGRTLIRCARPRNAFARALRALAPEDPPPAGIHASACIAASAVVGPRVSVGPQAVVEAGASLGSGCVVGPLSYVGAGAVLGAGCRLFAGAKVYGNARLGERVVLHAGAVVGADGFGWVFESDRYEKFPQQGGVEIGSDVEIGANACVDRGALDSTRIGDGTKLDNLVHIGHNCQIGRHVVMAAQVGLSGGVVVEDYAVLGGQVGVGDGARIRSGVQLGGQGGLLPGKSIGPGGAHWGTPAQPLRQHLTQQALVRRLPRLFDQVKRLRHSIKRLERS